MLDLALAVERGWEALREDLNSLTDRAVEVGYPGFSCGKDDAEGALAIAEKVRRRVRQALGVPDLG